MDRNRRIFLKGMGAAATALGLGYTFPLLRTLAFTNKTPEKDTGLNQLCMVIDIQKCRNMELVRACTEVCRLEHNLPGEESNPERLIRWMWTERFDHVFPDQTHSHTPPSLQKASVLLLCNHCTTPACVKVCPTKATWKRKSDGVVMMDMHRCIGCRYCVVGCPYGARSFNWWDPRPHIEKIRPEYPTRMRGVAEKCTFCAERLRQGREPACVEASRYVPGGEGALRFGRLSDPKIAGLLRNKYTISRQNALGTGPNVYYIV